MFTTLDQSLREYVLKNFLPGEKPNAITVDTPLIETGVLDSLAMTQFIVYLEKEYGINVASQEITNANFGSTSKIAAFVQARKASQG